jgi:hypothetical protein
VDDNWEGILDSSQEGILDGTCKGILEGLEGLDGNCNGIMDGPLEGAYDGIVDGDCEGNREGIMDGSFECHCFWAFDKKMIFCSLQRMSLLIRDRHFYQFDIGTGRNDKLDPLLTAT